MWNQSSNQTSHQSARRLVRRLVSGPFGSDCKTVLHIPHTSLIHVAQTHKATISCSHNNLQRIWEVQQNLKLKWNRGTILNLHLSLKHRFDVGYGWWTPAASKAKPLMDAKVRHEDPKKGLHDVRSFIGTCNFYRRHIKNFTYTSAVLTDLIKKSTTWRWGPQEQQPFDELKDKVANAKCLGVPRAQGEIILVTDASNVGGGGTLFQWQALEKEDFDSAISQWGTEGLNRDGTLKHSYPDDKWVLVPLGHWNWKWNQARGNYSTYEQELLAGMLVLSSQAQLLGSNPVVWPCDQEQVRTFQKGPPSEKAKLRRWWTYLSPLRLTVHHIQGVKNECADYINRNNFDALIGARSEALAFSSMDVQLDLNMTMIRPLDGLQQ